MGWREADVEKPRGRDGSMESYSEGDTMSRRDQGARKAQAGVLGGSDPQGAGWFVRGFPVSGFRCIKVAGSICICSIRDTEDSCCLMQEDNGKNSELAIRRPCFYSQLGNPEKITSFL